MVEIRLQGIMFGIYSQFMLLFAPRVIRL